MEAEIGKKYIHYKNKKKYLVLNFAIHTETGEEMVVYEGQYDDPEFGHNPIWVRPRKMFEEAVETESGNVHRFELIE
jgi:cyclomaltodextrinase